MPGVAASGLGVFLTRQIVLGERCSADDDDDEGDHSPSSFSPTPTHAPAQHVRLPRALRGRLQLGRVYQRRGPHLLVPRPHQAVCVGQARRAPDPVRKGHGGDAVEAVYEQGEGVLCELKDEGDVGAWYWADEGRKEADERRGSGTSRKNSWICKRRWTRMPSVQSGGRGGSKRPPYSSRCSTPRHSADSTNAERRAIMASASGGSPSQALALRRSRSPSRSPSPTPEPEDELVMPPGGFPTHAAAEEAFIALLKKTKIDETLPWEKVMPKVVMHPLYKALQTLAEKKAAWAKVRGWSWRDTAVADASTISTRRPSSRTAARPSRPAWTSSGRGSKRFSTPTRASSRIPRSARWTTCSRIRSPGAR